MPDPDWLKPIAAMCKPGAIIPLDRAGGVLVELPRVIGMVRLLGAELEANNDELLRLYALANDDDAPLIMERCTTSQLALAAYKSGVLPEEDA